MQEAGPRSSQAHRQTAFCDEYSFCDMNPLVLRLPLLLICFLLLLHLGPRAVFHQQQQMETATAFVMTLSANISLERRVLRPAWVREAQGGSPQAD